MTIESVGIVGAGQMGSGIAQVCAMAGMQVVLSDAKEDALGKALTSIGHNLDRQVAKGTIDEATRDAAMGRIHTASNLAAFANVDIAIEAATEKEDVKRGIFRSLTPHLKPATRLAASTDRPDRFIGMHFMNPVPVMKLVEIIRGIATEKPTFDAVVALSERLGKTVAVAEDFPAFIVNRILLPMINEAVYALHEGVGSVVSIDTALRLGVNHKMGPLELADFIGLDTCLSIMQVLHEGLADSKYRPCPLLVKYVEAGWLGRKTQRGFYDYRGEKPVPTR